MRPTLPRLLLLLVLAVFVGHVFRHWGYLIDDTFISLRYARNLVEGHGLVFNPGERVEGYTNFSFVLLAALLLRLGIDPVSGGSAVMAAMAGVTLWTTARLERRVTPPDAPWPAWPLSLLLLLPTGAFAYWSFRALETALFTALLAVALLLLVRERESGRWRGSGLVFAALALTRPEGVYLFALSLLAFVLWDRVEGRGWRLRSLGANGLAFALPVGLHLAWRRGYYEGWLPNTFHAKVTGGDGQLATGLAYVIDWALFHPLLAAVLLLPFALASTRVRRRLARPGLLAVLGAIGLGWVAYVVAVGGDFMPFYRFLLPGMPLLALLAAAVLRALPVPAAAWPRVFGPILALHVGVTLLAENPSRAAFVSHRTTLVGQRVGEWYAGQLPPAALLAVNTAGSLPYHARRPAIDMLGLTNREIARSPQWIVSRGWAGHRRGWGAAVLARRPHVIQWYNTAGAVEPFYLGDHQLADDFVFRFFYRMRDRIFPPPGGAEGPLIKRFLGFPFGRNDEGEAVLPHLGVSAGFRSGLLDVTTFREGALRLVYFEFDARDEALWEEAGRRRDDVAGFVAAAAERWAQQAALRPPVDANARLRVETLCARAELAIQAGDHARARALLDEAVGLNADARSPRVPHYVANLAVLTGALLPAVTAQKEALRLAPQSRLYRDNLVRLLSVPFDGFAERAAGGLQR